MAIEKNLASLGYFTPSNKRVRTQTTKTVTFTKIVDGKRLQAKATIIPGVTFGLPTTADQDKYFTLQKIVMDSKKRYDELCQVLNLHSYSHTSKIKEKLGPSLDELVDHGYIAGWNLDLTCDHAGYKIIFRHGERFGGDQGKMMASQSNSQVHQTLREEEQKLNPSLVLETGSINEISGNLGASGSGKRFIYSVFRLIPQR